MQRPVLDYHKPVLREEFLRTACALLHTGARAGAIAQVCIAFAVFVMLSHEPMNVGIRFWRKEAMIATAISLVWVVCAWNRGRSQAVAFLMFNALGCGISMLMPTLNYN